MLDMLRIIAMLDIVSIHVTGRYLLEGIGLPVFIIVAVALSVRKPILPAWDQLPEAASRRALRVLWPWGVWTAFFSLNLIFWAAFDPEETVRTLFYPWMLAGGTSVHLWFLPFIFVAELATLAVLHPLRRLPTRAVILGAVALAIGCVVMTGAVYDAARPIYGPLSMDSEIYAERAAFYGWTVRKSWLFGSASVCLGIAVGRTLSLHDSATPRRVLLIAAAVGLGLYFLWSRQMPGAPIQGHAIWLWWRQFAALLAVAVAVQFTGSTPPWITRVAVLTMGIYLLHGFVASRLGDLLGSLYNTPAWSSFLWPIGSVLHHPLGKLSLVWLLTAGLVAVLRRSRTWRRVL